MARLREEDEGIAGSMDDAMARIHAAAQVTAAGHTEACGIALDALDLSHKACTSALHARRNLADRTARTEGEIAKLIEEEYAKELDSLGGL